MPIDHRSRGLRRLITAAIAIVGLPALVAAPAGAHPFGPPLSARVDVDGAELTVTWTAAEDDWVNLGEHVGAFATQSDENGTRLTGAELLARSDNVPSYLLAHIGVTQDGRACQGRVTQLQDLLVLGAQLVYRCPQPVTVVDLTFTTLTDVNENYRTVVTSDGASQPAQALFTSTTATQEWRFDAEPSAATPSLALIAAGVLVLGAAAGGALWWRRGGGRRPDPAGTGQPLEVAR